MPKLTFLKDIFFLLAILGCLVAANVYGKIVMWMGFAFLGLYLVYVGISVLIMRHQNSKTDTTLEESLTNNQEGNATKAIVGSANTTGDVVNDGRINIDISEE